MAADLQNTHGTMKFYDGKRTFRPRKTYESGSKRDTLHNKVKATLGSGDLQNAVRVPMGEDPDEWLAVNTVDFYNEINLLFGTVSEFCTQQSCPEMSAGPQYLYLWRDSNHAKPENVSAPRYVELLMDWIEVQLDDEGTFPSKSGNPFPSNFRSVVKNIFKRLFRVYGHIYHCHFEEIRELKMEAHLNTGFKHFIFFTNEFSLIDKKELAPLGDLIDMFLRNAG